MLLFLHSHERRLGEFSIPDVFDIVETENPTVVEFNHAGIGPRSAVDAHRFAPRSGPIGRNGDASSSRTSRTQQQSVLRLQQVGAIGSVGEGLRLAPGQAAIL